VSDEKIKEFVPSIVAGMGRTQRQPNDLSDDELQRKLKELDKVRARGWVEARLTPLPR
jgi:hypothetical protein